MNRIVKVVTLTTVCAGFLLGAAPSSKKATEQISPATESPNAVDPIEATSASLPATGIDLRIDDSKTPSAATSAEAAATYEIDWYSINGGGTVNAASTNYRMGASIGQSVAGAASSANYNMGIGFWYGAGASCACDCHNDPVCDAVISNVQDVVATINVAFRGGAALIDPNANCPYEQSDVNCDTFTSVLDVVLVVNVAFRGFNPATTYCVACP